MPSWNSRGLRGSMLEEALNMTNEQYRKEHLALVQKIPTPIKPINIDNVQCVPMCFDAKECAGERFALQNIHEHQMEYMQDFERQDGIAFLIVYFKEAGAYYYVPFRDVKRFWDRAAEGGRKSFLRHELDQDYQIRTSNQIFIHYLDALSRDLESRPES